MRDTKFQEWLLAHQPADNMLWKQPFWNTYILWRDTIIPMFSTVQRTWADYEKTADDIDAFTEVVGEHYSKSILNPVLKLTYRGVTMVIRYNFYDYEIAVVSEKPLNFPVDHLFRSKEGIFFYEGIPEEYQLKTYYPEDKCRFMAKVSDHYQFYTFMFVLKDVIDKALLSRGVLPMETGALIQKLSKKLGIAPDILDGSATGACLKEERGQRALASIIEDQTSQCPEGLKNVVNYAFTQTEG